MKCPLCSDIHFFDHTSDPAIPIGIFVCAKCGTQIETKTPATTEQSKPLPAWVPPAKPEIPMRQLALHETIQKGDFFKDTELLAPIEITSTQIFGMKVKDICFHFNRETFKGFFKKI
jgi:hypothetical protein